jgi:3-dehydroquinate dehydratase type I
MTIRICVSIRPESNLEAQRLLREAEEATVNFIEIRLDDLKDPKLEEFAIHKKTPLIATDRSNRPEAERLMLLLKAAKSGFNYVDVDLQSHKLQNFVSQAKVLGAKCIVSSHNVDETPSMIELNRILERQVSSGADVCKIVTTAKRMEDNLTLLQFIQAAPVRKKPICFAMGSLGKTSRLLSAAFGSFFTFAILEKGSETAPGQMTVAEMRSAYELLGLM